MPEIGLACLKGGACSAENTSEGPDVSVSWHARRMRKSTLNRRVLLLLALLAAGLGVYVRYARLRREEIELPRTRAALGRVEWLASQLSELAKFGLRRHVDAWTSACVKRLWGGDDGRKPFGEAYQHDLGRTAGVIGEIETAGAFATLYAPGAESLARLLALRDWLHAEPANDEVWTCTNSDMLEKLDRLKGVVAAHADCLARLAALDAVQVYRAGKPVPDDCAAALRRLPLPEHAAAPEATPDRRLAGERTVPLGRPGDRVLKVLTSAQKEISFVTSPDGSRMAYVVARDGKQLVIVDGVEGAAYDAVWTGVNTNGVIFADYPGGPVFSADSRHVAYPAERDGKWFVVLDGREGTPWDAIEGFAIGPRAPRIRTPPRSLRVEPLRDAAVIGAHVNGNARWNAPLSMEPRGVRPFPVACRPGLAA